ncbi:cobalt-precorrin 5A hydrolase [Clostridium omnivorum]|uniref:Cobalamin biosynthesis protein CbiG n=1 Tax=Clostridium omnivorum TaxID=1604902 RepID=A0ABQ5NB76_9CLOT|nr:cobalt-precorrin 5A hydrolase [Clostridium sp. E14]GLC32478.1 cobalamin biosynthesis protein CbiG [Clostridium sp. E14]
MNIGVISVTKQGDKIADKVIDFMAATLYSKSTISNFNLMNITKELMEKCDAIIFIASTGIAVRAVAPYLKNKAVDPAVLVVDCSGNFVISLLSGHLGGANELALRVADLIKAQPVITTATDNLGLTAPDMIAKDNNLIIEDLKKAKIIAAKMVEGQTVAFIDEKKLLAVPKGYVDGEKLLTVPNIVYVTNKLNLPEKFIDSSIEALKLIRRDIILGIGCRKDYNSDKMRKTIIEALVKENIDRRSVKAIATVEIKKEERAIIELAEFLNCPISIFTVDEIKKVQHKYEGSDFVEKTIGVRAVCEPAVELSKGRLLTGKLSLGGMTLCIGEEIL